MRDSPQASRVILPVEFLQGPRSRMRILPDTRWLYGFKLENPGIFNESLWLHKAHCITLQLVCGLRIESLGTVPSFAEES
jgi:hypothetical protein